MQSNMKPLIWCQEPGFLYFEQKRSFLPCSSDPINFTFFLPTFSPWTSFRRNFFSGYPVTWYLMHPFRSSHFIGQPFHCHSFNIVWIHMVQAGTPALSATPGESGLPCSSLKHSGSSTCGSSIFLASWASWKGALWLKSLSHYACWKEHVKGIKMPTAVRQHHRAGAWIILWNLSACPSLEFFFTLLSCLNENIN